MAKAVKNIFLTGEIGIGKSTIITRVLEEADYNLGGYRTRRRVDGDIQEFSREALADGRLYNFARTNRKKRLREVNEEVFTELMPVFLREDMKDKELIILDELGFMENDLEAFTSTIFEILDSPLMVLGVLRDYDCEFLNKVRARGDVEVLRVTLDNRDLLPSRISSRLNSLKDR